MTSETNPVKKVSKVKKVSNPIKTSFPKNKINILLLEGISQKAVDNLISQGYNVETQHRITKTELIKKLSYVHVLGVRSKTKLTEEVLSHGKKLLCIGCFCIGTDQTNLEYSCKVGIPVFNSPFANTRSVAELVIANIICLSRKAGDQNKNMHQGKWTKTANNCFEIRGKTLGIVGYGHVGSQLSVLAEAMGMKVLYYDIIPKLPLGNAISSPSMNDLLSKSTFVSLHVPYTKETHNLISSRELKIMKKGSYLLNASRGKCVSIPDVVTSIKTEHLNGCYFDVYPSEPTNETLPLCNLPNVILSPHIGGSTVEAQHNIGLEVSNKIIKYINEGNTISSVNFPNINLSANLNVHRILHIHNNVPGVIRKCMEILSNYNISSQVLKTNKQIGYMLIECDSNKKLSTEVKKLMDQMKETITTRVVYSPGGI